MFQNDGFSHPPFLTIVVTLTLVLFALGSHFASCRKAVINGIALPRTSALVLAISHMQRIQQLIVITGLHHSLSIIELGLLNTLQERMSCKF